jgi:radical SAM superfamily enzyme YgiQ (UPF0313 family)
MTSITENYNLAQFYAHLIKKTNFKIKVIIGGVHISAVPHSLSRNIDIGVIGEGEQTFLELLKSDFEPNDRIKGIVYWRNNVLHKTEDRNLIEPLDLIPHPKRDMFGSEQREQYLFTSRGCPYRCAFCFSSRFWKKVRFHSAEYVAEEIHQIKMFKVSHLTIYDDLFILDVERVRRIKDLVKDLGLTYSIAARANLITEEVATILKDMRVIAVGIGFESNSQRILDYLHKGNTVEDNQNAVNILRKHKIRINGSFIRNIPIETKKDLKLTYKFIHQNKILYDMYRLMKYPGTPIYDGCEDWDSAAVFQYEPKTVKIRRFLARIKPLEFAYHKVRRAIKDSEAKFAEHANPKYH